MFQGACHLTLGIPSSVCSTEESPMVTIAVVYPLMRLGEFFTDRTVMPWRWSWLCIWVSEQSSVYERNTDVIVDGRVDALCDERGGGYWQPEVDSLTSAHFLPILLVMQQSDPSVRDLGNWGDVWMLTMSRREQGSFWSRAVLITRRRSGRCKFTDGTFNIKDTTNIR